MTSQSFHNLYQVLDLPAGADQAQLRLHYRRLAQRLHPDAVGGDAASFQTLQHAYDSLRRYHEKHGALPLQKPLQKPLQEQADSGPAAATTNNETPTPGVRRRPINQQPRGWRRRRTIVLCGLIAIGLWGYYSEPGTFLQSDTSSQLSTSVTSNNNAAVTSPTITANKTTPLVENKTFSLGATLTEVFDAQGIPDTNDNGVWHYGGSRVYFFEGKVIGWQESALSPLNLHLHHSRNSTVTFSLGAAPQQVLSAQGTPNHMTNREWTYGLSSVYFDNTGVIGWHEDPANPLALEKKANARVQTK